MHHHLALTDFGGTVSLYIDGSFDSSLSYTPDGTGTTLDRTALGKLVRLNNFGNYTGLMDEVAIYDRVLTPGEIGQLAAGLDPVAIPDEGTPPSPLDFRLASAGTDLIFTWNSETGNFYNLKTSTNLRVATSTWHLLESALAATAPLNTRVIAKPADRRRFYVLEDTSDTKFGLWSGAAIPADHTTIPFAQGIEHYTLLNGSDHTHRFLHGAIIIKYQGELFANWANSPVDENSQDETLQGRRFTDAGDTNTWSAVEVIGSDLLETNATEGRNLLNSLRKYGSFLKSSILVASILLRESKCAPSPKP